MPKCDFSKVAKHWHGCSVNFVYIFRTPFLENTSGGQFLYFKNRVKLIMSSYNHKNIFDVISSIFDVISRHYIDVGSIICF